MWPFGSRERDPFQSVSQTPSDGAPPGYRLRRVGPGEWIAEPSKWVWIAAGVAAVALGIGALIGAYAARAYYHRSATVMLLTVNGTPFRRDDLRNRLEGRYGISEVVQFASDELSRQFAVQRGCWPTDAEVEARFEKERARPDYVERIRLAGLTDDGVKQNLRLDLAQTKLLIKGVTVTPDEVREFCLRNADPANPAARYHTPDRVQVTGIAVSTSEAAAQASKDLAAGLSWATVATRYSEDASRITGGLMPPFARGESLFATTPATETAIFAMRPGDRIGPVAAARKWWLIRCENKWRETTVSWPEAREDARIGAMLAKGIAMNRDKLEKDRVEFVRRSSIRVFEDAYGDAQEPDLSRPVRW